MNSLHGHDRHAHAPDDSSLGSWIDFREIGPRCPLLQFARRIGGQFDPIAILKAKLARSGRIDPRGIGMHDLGEPLEIHRSSVVVDVPFETGHDQFVIGQFDMFLRLNPDRHRIDFDVIVPCAGVDDSWFA